ncbi:MAG: hypothetical protein ACLU00_04880 [Mediterraneibacter faecis]
MDSMETTRVQLGINPYQFGWQLSPGTSFCTPEAVLVYSANGLAGMSNTFHRVIQNARLPGMVQRPGTASSIEQLGRYVF